MHLTAALKNNVQGILVYDDQFITTREQEMMEMWVEEKAKEQTTQERLKESSTESDQ